MKLIAVEVYYHPSDDNRCATVGFRAEDDAYFLLSRSLEPTHQERRLGLDGIHAELSDQGLSCYDGIAAVSVTPNVVRFEFNEKGEDQMDQEFVEVHLDLTLERSAQMREVLAIVFQDFPRYADGA